MLSLCDAEQHTLTSIAALRQCENENVPFITSMIFCLPFELTLTTLAERKMHKNCNAQYSTTLMHVQ